MTEIWIRNEYYPRHSPVRL